MAHWWQTIPWRMVQTNLPDRAMADMDAARFARDLKDFGATVVNLNAAGIVANYETKLDFQPRNPYLTGDSLADVVAACHAQGIRVIARTDFFPYPAGGVRAAPRLGGPAGGRTHPRL